MGVGSEFSAPICVFVLAHGDAVQCTLLQCAYVSQRQLSKINFLNITYSHTLVPSCAA